MNFNYKLYSYGCAPFNSLPFAQVLDTSNSSNMQSVTQLVEAADPIASNVPQQVTQFVDDTAVQYASLPDPIVPNKDVLAPGLETREHNIIDVLERPVKLESFEWNDTQSFDTEIKIYSFPDSIFSNAPNVLDKIAHFTFLRAHIEIRFVVNANTFQAGRLLAYFAPFSDKSEIGDRVDVNNYMSAKSVFPRVVLDAGSGNVGELTIPYVSYFTHYDLARGLGDLGSVRISVLNPLQSGNANVSVFARFKEISLQMPTAVPNNLGSFSGVINDFKTFILKNPDCRTKSFRDRFHEILSNSVSYEEIAPGRFRRDLSDSSYISNFPKAQVGEATKRATTGLVTLSLSTLGKMASVGGSLPVIGPYLTSISWISTALSQLSSYFGFSKSTNLRPIDKFAILPAYGFTNVDGVDNSLVLGSSIENEIGSRLDLFGSNIDEMDIPFICKHESFLTNFTWSVSSNPGDIIFKTIVSPGALDYDASSGSTFFNSTALGYVSSMFRYWRGSIKYKIQVTKTAYHSGRLRVAFVPSGKLDVTSLNTYDFNQGYSEIVDLRTSDEIEFTIPFVSNTLWKPSRLEKYDNPQFYSSSMGVLVVEVINSLRNPDTVTNTLDCNVWVSSGDDIQFAIPDFAQNAPVIDNTSGFEFLDFRDGKHFNFDYDDYDFLDELPQAQVLGQFQDTGFNQSMTNTNEMFSSPQTSSIDASATSIGEHIQNLRQLIKRFGVISKSSRISPTTSLRLTASYFGTPRLGDNISDAVLICPLDYVSWLYRFYRGGIRYKAIAISAPQRGPFGVVSNPGITASPTKPTTGSDVNLQLENLLSNSSLFRHYIDLAYNRILEFTLPYFSNTHISLLRGTNVSPTEFDDRTSQAYLFSANNSDVDVLKSAADDFSFGWLVGPPKLVRIPPIGLSVGFSFQSVDYFGYTRTFNGFDWYSLGTLPYQITGSRTLSCKIPVGDEIEGHPIVFANPSVLKISTSSGDVEVLTTSCLIQSVTSLSSNLLIPLPIGTKVLDKNLDYFKGLAQRNFTLPLSAEGKPCTTTTSTLRLSTITDITPGSSFMQITGIQTTPLISSGVIATADISLPVTYSDSPTVQQVSLASSVFASSLVLNVFIPNPTKIDSAKTRDAIKLLADQPITVV